MLQTVLVVLLNHYISHNLVSTLIIFLISIVHILDPLLTLSPPSITDVFTVMLVHYQNDLGNNMNSLTFGCIHCLTSLTEADKGFFATIETCT